MSKAKETKKTKRNYSRTIDLFFLLVLLICMVGAFYIAFNFKILPTKWIMMGALVFAILFAILFLLSLKRMPTWAIVTKRIFIVLLCAALGVGGFFLNKTRTTINKVSSSSTEVTKQKMMVLVPKDSTLTTVKQLSAANVGFQTGTDTENASYIKQQLSKDVSNFRSVEVNDYTTLIDNLLNTKTIDALAISESYYKMSVANIEDFKDSVKELTSYEKEVQPKKASTKDISKETFTVYLSGLDNMGSPDQVTRTDTNLLLIVNPVAKHIDMVSLPRDGYMPNTALNNMNDKLTHTGNFGVETSVATIENFFGIPIDFYARVSFNSLIEIVDTIGGIDVDVEIDFCEQDENRSFEQEDLICLNKGEQHLDGKQALAYSRHRHTEGYDNPGRERAQQRIIKAIINKMISPSALGYLNSLLDIIPSYVITNVSSDQIADFVSNELDDMSNWTISSITSDTGVYDDQIAASTAEMGTSDCYLFSQDEVHVLLNALDGASNQLQMNTFNFDLTNLYKNTPKLNTNPKIVWDYEAVNPH